MYNVQKDEDNYKTWIKQILTYCILIGRQTAGSSRRTNEIL